MGQVLQNAIVFDFSRHRGPQILMNASNIPAEVERLFALLEEKRVDYLLVGGVAMLAHVRGRNTEDIDLIVSLSEQARLAPVVHVIERESFFAEARFESLRVDFWEAEHSLFSTVARDYAEEREFDFLGAGRRIKCASPAGLMLLKLYALPSFYRQGKIERARIYESDVAQLLHAFPAIDLETLFALLLRHGALPGDVAELRRVVLEQRARPDRFSSS